MSPLLVGLIGIIVLLILFILRVPIGFSMGIVAFAGYAYLVNLKGALSLLGVIPYSTAASYELSVIPLFVLVGYFFLYSGSSRDFYDAAYKWIGKLPGSLAMASIATCAAFASICGSSPATAATVGAVAIPEMRRYNYNAALACGACAAGGTLGIMIPPSIIFIIYGILCEQSIGALFLAGIFPGLVLAGLYMLTIYIMARFTPHSAPPGPSFSFKEKVASLKGVWSFMIVFLIIMVGIYGGFFTATEAAAIGCASAIVITAATRKLNWSGFLNALREGVKVTGMIYGILIGAFIFNNFMAVSKIPMELAGMVSGLQVPSMVIIILILIILMVLGCFMDSMTIVILTMPIFFPVVSELGFNPILFGVLVVLLVELGLMTPPVGGNVYIISGIVPDVPLFTIFRGVYPFIGAALVGAAILLAFPQIALFLPQTMH